MALQHCQTRQFPHSPHSLSGQTPHYLPGAFTLTLFPFPLYSFLFTPCLSFITYTKQTSRRVWRLPKKRKLRKCFPHTKPKQQILRKCFLSIYCFGYYLVRWSGKDPDTNEDYEDSWEPATPCLNDCPLVIASFKNDNANWKDQYSQECEDMLMEDLESK